MLIVLAVLFALAWILGFVVFHVTPIAIHVLLIIAVIALVVHFARGRRAGP
jgi:hypothetical protein